MWCPRGVYIGTVPVLIYVNDLSQSLSESVPHLYADGACSFYQDKDVHKIENVLNKEFSILCECFVDNKLQ